MTVLLTQGVTMSLGATAVQTAAGMLGQPLYSGRCEQFVRTCFGFPAMYSSAALAWTNARGRHEGDWSPPAGVPVFWDILSGPNAPYDHIALSVGGGYVITTSAGKGKTITRISIKDLTKLWAMRYLGWAEIYHDTRVWEPLAPAAPDTEEDPDMAYDATAAYRDELILGSVGRMEAALYALSKQVSGLDVDEEQIAATVLAGLTPEKIAAAIPPALAGEVAGLLTVTARP